MSDICFYVLALLTLLFGAAVVANPFSRSPVASAMFLVLTIISLAGLFALLHAFFLAAVQVLVYAGAVMVLFLLVIMTLNLKQEEQRKIKKFGLVTGVVSALGLTGLFGAVLWQSGGLGGATGPVVEGSPASLGETLFRQYLLPFEVLAVLLLAAMVGVVLLTRKEGK
jgi:NADH-quinone oxidoreductase subunit J